MLERAEDGFQKQNWINGQNMRCYTVTSNVFSSLTPESGVRGVSGVRSANSDEAPTAEKCPETRPLTTLTPLTPQEQSETVEVLTPRTCEQCGALDGTEQLIDGAWLHKECVRFWKERLWT